MHVGNSGEDPEYPGGDDYGALQCVQHDQHLLRESVPVSCGGGCVGRTLVERSFTTGMRSDDLAGTA